MGFLDKMKQAKDMYGNMKKIQQFIKHNICGENPGTPVPSPPSVSMAATAVRPSIV